MATGFMNGMAFKKLVTDTMLQTLQNHMQAFNAQSTDLLHQAITDLGVVDTGQLLESSYTNVVSTPNSVILTATTGVDYAIYPLLGLGSSRNVGPRNWFFLWANKVTTSLGLSGFNNTTFQPAPASSINKSYTVKTFRRENITSIKALKGFSRGNVTKLKSGAYSVKFTRKK
jgi:hypothetical protein